jgi:hypothetical protein
VLSSVSHPHVHDMTQGDLSAFHSSLQVKQPLTAPCDGSSARASDIDTALHDKLREIDRTLAEKKIRSLKGNPDIAAMMQVNGSPELKDMNFGDGYVSAMLSLVEAKLAFMEVWANANIGE